MIKNTILVILAIANILMWDMIMLLMDLVNNLATGQFKQAQLMSVIVGKLNSLK